MENACFDADAYYLVKNYPYTHANSNGDIGVLTHFSWSMEVLKRDIPKWDSSNAERCCVGCTDPKAQLRMRGGSDPRLCRQNPSSSQQLSSRDVYIHELQSGCPNAAKDI